MVITSTGPVQGNLSIFFVRKESPRALIDAFWFSREMQRLTRNRPGPRRVTSHRSTFLRVSDRLPYTDCRLTSGETDDPSVRTRPDRDGGKPDDVAIVFNTVAGTNKASGSAGASAPSYPDVGARHRRGRYGPCCTFKCGDASRIVTGGHPSRDAHHKRPFSGCR